MSEISDVAVMTAAADYRGYFDRFQDGNAVGWVMDMMSPGTPVLLDVMVDGVVVDVVVTDGMRDDVRAILQLPDGRVGFSWDVPNTYLDGLPHRLGFRLPDGGYVAHIGEGGITDLRDVHVFSGHPIVVLQGRVDHYARGAIRGWVVRRVGRAAQGNGGCDLLVLCDGVRIGQIKANRFRLDVAAAFGADANCGFEFVVPARHRKSYPQTFRFIVVPDGLEIDNSPFVTGVVDDHLEGRLLDAIERVNRLHGELLRDLTALRRDIDDLLPQPRDTVENYDFWARRYYDDLRTRVARARPGAGRTEAGPLVSVLMPTYRPDLSDFVTAVDSVLSQTWKDWELVIVDDGGKAPEVTRRMNAFAASDDRIRLVKRRKNGGISAATNAAIAAARGDWIAFFDHDDMLVDVALEVMMSEARETGARMLYSDEDKIDRTGFLTEPNFKPDWNGRYVLGCNYVCHLLVVAADVVRAVGPLRSDYDGAQDHDYILRISEEIGAEAIHHVPELLYHWRKTPNSTASDISNKGYAVDAGVRAVSDHLGRRDRDASVSSINGLTIYKVEFDLGRTPPVTVIIPYKDQVAMTRRCVRTLLERTDYPDLSVVLVDNWSTTREAVAFRTEMAGDRRIRVLVVEEEFNYSRLNNLAAASAPDAEFLVLMNNDVFVTDPRWLRRMLGEMSDATVGAVGAKLVYPEGGVQHAGVIVGIHGVAAHMHAGVPPDDYGYIGRARLSQELTAVTAALMVVRNEAYRALGGFDEATLAVAYNDVDFCLRLRDRGWRVILNADTVAEHHESVSRGSDQRPEQERRFFAEQQTMLERWRDHPLFRNDPAYSRWFTRDDRPFFDLLPPKLTVREG